jgi:hypothetical protein
MNQNLDFLNLLNIDIATRPGEAFLKCIGCVTLGSVFETPISDMHLPPIILEVARLLAYLGASVAFFRFVISLFKKKVDQNTPTSVDKDEA